MKKNDILIKMIDEWFLTHTCLSRDNYELFKTFMWIVRNSGGKDV